MHVRHEAHVFVDPCIPNEPPNYFIYFRGFSEFSRGANHKGGEARDDRATAFGKGLSEG